MFKGELITTIDGISFYYGGYNFKKGYALIFTSLYNFHIHTDNSCYVPNINDCTVMYKKMYM